MIALTNRIPVGMMEDDQRKAMFARMHGGFRGGGGGSSGGHGASRSWSTGTTGASESAALHKLTAEEWANPAVGAAPSPSALKDALVTFGSMAVAGGIGKYRAAHPTMDPRTEHALALTESVAESVAAVYGFRTGKNLVAGTRPVKAVGKALESIFKKANTALAKVGAKIPGWIKSPLALVKKAYDGLAEWTSVEIPAIGRALGAPGRLLKSGKLTERAAELRAQAQAIIDAAAGKAGVMKDQGLAQVSAAYKGSQVWWPTAQKMYLGGQKRFYDAVRGELASGRSAESLLKIADKMAAKAGELKGTALKDIIKSALLLVGAGAKEAYERHQVNDYYKEIKAAYDSGKDYELSPDVNIAANPLAQAGLTVASSLGNPVEKSISDYAKGRYTSDRAEEARYQVLYDKIGELERNGTYTKVEAESERKKLAANKPWNLEGTVARTFTPAIGNFVKWKGGEIIRDVTAPQDYVKIADDPGDPSVVERDADTFKTADGRRVRYKGIDATEIAHTAKAGSVDEPFARAAAERVKELAPDGSYVRIKKDTKNPDQDKDAYGRELRYVERLRGPQVVTDVVAKIPGLRNIWPAEDVQKTLVTEGLAKPAYESLDPSRHERAGEYHQASVAAMQRAVGLNSPEGIGTQKSQWWNPQGAKVVDGKWQIPEQPQGLNPAYGAGLMISGQSGIPGKAGAIGSGFMQSYNALLATLGTADIAKRGPKNAKGKKLPRPALYKQAEDQEMEKRIERRRTRRK